MVSSAIHGSEGVDAMFQIAERLATTPYGDDPEVDAILDHLLLIWNVAQNPDGRIANQRANGNGFDLNRDWLTQSQPETLATAAVIRDCLPVDLLGRPVGLGVTLAAVRQYVDVAALQSAEVARSGGRGQTGGMITTAHHLARLVDALLGGRLLTGPTRSSPTPSALRRPSALPSGGCWPAGRGRRPGCRWWRRSPRHRRVRRRGQ